MSKIKDMTNLALKQLGNGYSKYCAYTGTYSEWCASFVSWLAGQNDLIGKCFIKTTGAGSMPRGCVPLGYGEFFIKGAKPPQEGDCILFRYGGTYSDRYHSDHIGYVYKVVGNYVYTVEGNVDCSSYNWSYQNTRVSAKCRTLSTDSVYAFYRPKYPDTATGGEDEMNFKKGDKSDGVLALKALIQQAYNLGIIKNTCDNTNSFGGGTYKAVLEVQKKYKLEQDGIAGTKTITALRNAINSAISSSKRFKEMHIGDWNVGVQSYKAVCDVARRLKLINAKTDTKLGFGDGTAKATKQIQALIGEKQTGIATEYTISHARVVINNALDKQLK